MCYGEVLPLVPLFCKWCVTSPLCCCSPLLPSIHHHHSPHVLLFHCIVNVVPLVLHICVMVRYCPCPSPCASDGVPLQLETTKNKNESFHSFNLKKIMNLIFSIFFSFHFCFIFLYFILIDFFVV